MEKLELYKNVEVTAQGFSCTAGETVGASLCLRSKTIHQVLFDLLNPMHPVLSSVMLLYTCVYSSMDFV